MRLFAGWLVAGLLVLPARAQEIACAAPAMPMLRAELMFGRMVGGRLGVSEAEWRRFVAGELTPRFPDGLSVIDAQGQWRSAHGVLVREPSKIVIIVLPDEASARERIAAAATAYKQRFHQQSVGVLTRPVCAAF